MAFKRVNTLDNLLMHNKTTDFNESLKAIIKTESLYESISIHQNHWPF